jgi:predicted DNA-binding transcriptional regulator YafY
MSRGKTRSERFAEMERLYIQKSFTDIEMAERLGVTRPTVYKDRMALEADVPFIKDEHGRWRIDRNKYITAVRVNLNEALALYLAARKASRQTRVAQPHVANAVSKLATTLKNPMAQRLVKAADTILSQQTQPERLAVSETITQAWVDGYKLQLDYHALNARHTITHVVRPYLIEPSLWSDSIYLIGLSENVNKLIPFKLSRIERARIMSETFTIPDEFDEQTLLHHAWGIWYAEQEPVEVLLRFRGNTAVQRLRETIWHPSEKLEPQENGDCLWRAQVAEWQEMLPWIRGWGADCEVLAPLELKASVMRDVRKMMQIYGLAQEVTSQTTSPVEKEQPQGEIQLPLIGTTFTVTNKAPEFANDVPSEMMEMFQAYMDDDDE